MIAAALAAFTATPALAADMAMKAPPAAVAPVYNWNGFYFGAHAGVGWSDGSAEANPLPSEAAFNELRHHFDIRAAGVLGGVQAGYNWITAPNWLAGLEVDGSWTGIRASASDNFLCSPSGGCSPGTTLMSRDLDWLASVRGRLGFV